jgi:hypothetical protein
MRGYLNISGQLNFLQWVSSWMLFPIWHAAVYCPGSPLSNSVSLGISTRDDIRFSPGMGGKRIIRLYETSENIMYLLQETIVMTDTIWRHWIRNSRVFLFTPTTELFFACFSCISLCSTVRKSEVLGFTKRVVISHSMWQKVHRSHFCLCVCVGVHFLVARDVYAMTVTYARRRNLKLIKFVYQYSTV